MRGKAYSTDDVRRVIRAIALYCSDLGPGGELPPVLDKDLLIFARTALQILSTGPDNDRRWRISHDWRRRIELIGLNPANFAIDDAEEFEVTANLMNFTRKQREAKKDQRRKLRGPTRGYYEKGERGSVAYIPEPPPESTNRAALPWENNPTSQPATGNSWAAAAEQVRHSKEEALARLEQERSG